MPPSSSAATSNVPSELTASEVTPIISTVAMIEPLWVSRTSMELLSAAARYRPPGEKAPKLCTTARSNSCLRCQLSTRYGTAVAPCAKDVLQREGNAIEHSPAQSRPSVRSVVADAGTGKRGAACGPVHG